ncbi:MAG: hypothetical protein OEN50_03940, partial [Deltaproteobacteria bacterium]|nr:hypothetical protein [Deltaproteobacteria bacterium]
TTDRGAAHHDSSNSLLGTPPRLRDSSVLVPTPQRHKTDRPDEPVSKKHDVLAGKTVRLHGDRETRNGG